MRADRQLMYTKTCISSFNFFSPKVCPQALSWSSECLVCPPHFVSRPLLLLSFPLHFSFSLLLAPIVISCLCSSSLPSFLYLSLSLPLWVLYCTVAAVLLRARVMISSLAPLCLRRRRRRLGQCARAFSLLLFLLFDEVRGAPLCAEGLRR